MENSLYILICQSRTGGGRRPDPMTKKLLWPYEIGRELGVCAATVRRLADAGAVEVIRDAKGRRRFRPEAIEILRRKLGLEEVIDSAEADHGHTPDAA
jgi:hypothetical protein